MSRLQISVVLTTMVLHACAVGAARAEEDQPATSTAPETSEVLLHPEKATLKAPDEYRVTLETTKGDVVIEVDREWAPHAADRFYSLVKAGYYDNTAFFRVIEGFMAQVGIHGDPAVNAAWRQATIPDDEVSKANTRGMVTFAMTARPDSRTTQFFINYGDNSYLAQHGKFAPFGRVVEGMEAVDELYAGYGEGAPRGRGPSQGRLVAEGNEYLRSEFPKLDWILDARVTQE